MNDNADNDPRIYAIPDIHGHAKGEHKAFTDERPIPLSARMLFLWFYHACRRGWPRFLMVTDHMNYLTFEDPAAINLVRRALKLAQAGDLYGAAETASVEVGHAAVVSEGLRRGMRYSIGAEVDNDPRSRPDAQNIVDAMKPDGMIRSVHFLVIDHPTHGPNWNWPFDNPEFAEVYDIVGTAKAWDTYMTTLLDAVERLPGNILGHFYVPATFGHWPDDATLETYEDQIVAACEARGMAIELNTRFLYRDHSDEERAKYLAAHRRLLAKCKAKNVGIAVGSDAHSPKDQGRAFATVLALLDECGINELVFPIAGRLAHVALRVERKADTPSVAAAQLAPPAADDRKTLRKPRTSEAPARSKDSSSKRDESYASDEVAAADDATPAKAKPRPKRTKNRTAAPPEDPEGVGAGDNAAASTSPGTGELPADDRLLSADSDVLDEDIPVTEAADSLESFAVPSGQSADGSNGVVHGADESSRFAGPGAAASDSFAAIDAAVAPETASVNAVIAVDAAAVPESDVEPDGARDAARTQRAPEHRAEPLSTNGATALTDSGDATPVEAKRVGSETVEEADLVEAADSIEPADAVAIAAREASQAAAAPEPDEAELVDIAVADVSPAAAPDEDGVDDPSTAHPAVSDASAPASTDDEELTAASGENAEDEPAAALVEPAAAVEPEIAELVAAQPVIGEIVEAEIVDALVEIVTEATLEPIVTASAPDDDADVDIVVGQDEELPDMVEAAVDAAALVALAGEPAAESASPMRKARPRPGAAKAKGGTGAAKAKSPGAKIKATAKKPVKPAAKVPAKKAVAKKTTAKKAAVKTAPAKKTAAKKAAPKKAAARATAGKKAGARKSAAKKTTAKKPAQKRR